MDSRFTNELFSSRTTRTSCLPVKRDVARFADTLLQILFPHFSDQTYFSTEDIEGAFKVLKRDLRSTLLPLEPQIPQPVAATCDAFFERVPGIYAAMQMDARAIFDGDPAAESVDEVISAYPGFLAIAFYRVAHEFYRLGVPLFPRILTEIAHERTGIDIHPGATIGTSFCIDHGTGIVIGETSVIGNNVKIYQGVTLGALSVAKSMKEAKRHPTIEDRVVIYSNATILGGSTVIGKDSVIGGNVWLTESVPPHSVIYHRSEVHVRDTREATWSPDFVI